MADIGRFAVKKHQGLTADFYRKCAKGGAKGAMEDWNFWAHSLQLHFLCALCADLVFFAVKKTSRH
jgi:hypothetical protein